MKHALRESALRSGDLAVVRFHRTDEAAAELVVLEVGPDKLSSTEPGLACLWDVLQKSWKHWVVNARAEFPSSRDPFVIHSGLRAAIVIVSPAGAGQRTLGQDQKDYKAQYEVNLNRARHLS